MTLRALVDRWRQLKVGSQLFFSVCLLELLVDIGEAFALNWNGQFRPIVAISLIFHSLFTLYLGMTGIWQENKYLLAAFLLAHIESMYYAGYLITSPDAVNMWCGIVLLAVFVLECALSPFAWKSMGWKFYKAFGTDVKLKDMHDDYQKFVTALQLDFQLVIRIVAVAFDIQLNISTTRNNIWIPIVLLILELVWGAMIRYALIHENKTLTMVSIGLALASFGVMIDFGVYLFEKFEVIAVTQDVKHAYYTLVYPLGVCVLLTRTFMIWGGKKVIFNYGKGLKERVHSKGPPTFFMGGWILKPPAVGDLKQPLNSNDVQAELAQVEAEKMTSTIEKPSTVN
jgi:hypothetical protein